MSSTRPGGLRSPTSDRVPQASTEALQPYLEEAEVARRRRKEIAAQMLADYEAEHGEISEEEMAKLEAEWRG